MALKVNIIERKVGVFVVTPVGAIDSDTNKILSRQVDRVLEAKPQLVIFDLDGVDYINSSGVGVILKTKKNLMDRQGKILLVNLQPQIREVFDIIRALPEQEIFKSVAELDSYLDARQQQKLSEDS